MKWVIVLLLMTGCTNNVQRSFRFDSCVVAYCEASEDSKLKNLSLMIARVYGLNVKRGFCSKYYDKREMNSGYVYARRSAVEVCEMGY